MISMIATRAAALSATLEALHDGFAQGRNTDNELQVALLEIAREQANALSRYVDKPTSRPAALQPAFSSNVVPFRLHAKTFISASN